MTSGDDQKSFSLSLHLIGIVSIFLFSVLGPILPLLATKFRSLNNIFTPTVIRIGKFFGTGCILATAFVHLLFPAATALNHPSLPKFFTQTYPPFAGVLALMGTFFMIFLDFFMNKWRNNQSSSSSSSSPLSSPSSSLASSTTTATFPSSTTPPPMTSPSNASLSPTPAIPLSSKSTSFYNSTPHASSLPHSTIHLHEPNGCGHACEDALLQVFLHPEEHEHKKLGFYFLEFGIALHSIIVGFTLGLTPTSTYVSLLVAVIFHQFFEGFALGALAAPLLLSKKALIALILFFSLTTTLGAILGTILQSVSTFTIDDPIHLIVQGVMSALSSGIMIYSAIIDVIVPELKNDAFYHLSTNQQITCLSCMLLGAAIMSLLAKWA